MQDNYQTFDSETSNVQPVNLSETSRETAWYIKEKLTHYRVFMFFPFFTTQSLNYNDRLIKVEDYSLIKFLDRLTSNTCQTEFLKVIL